MKNYLVAYDIANSKIQSCIRYRIKNFSITGQYSAYECQLTVYDIDDLLCYVRDLLTKSDAFFIIKIKQNYWCQHSTKDISRFKPNTADYLYIE